MPSLSIGQASSFGRGYSKGSSVPGRELGIALSEAGRAAAAAPWLKQAVETAVTHSMTTTLPLSGLADC